MAKLRGLQFSKPIFDWESGDKLTELEQFKADCRILFDSPLSDLKEKQRARLLVNWLGREATQILNSVDAQIDNTNEVFEALEKVFRLESNQTLAQFKFRNMKQKASQTCDAYMSELRLTLPECKYRNDADELLKDQFIFGIYNKEIQDHLLGEIKETDNSVRSLYEARKIESKLAQRKLLGIVTPTAVSVEAIKKGKGKSHTKHYSNCKFCGCSHDKGECPAFGKTCNKCGGKNHFRTVCKSKESESRHDSRRPNGARKNKCSRSVVYMKSMKMSVRWTAQWRT